MSKLYFLTGSCYSPTISFEPDILQAYSMEPIMSLFSIFPAIRVLNISPSPWSKISSAEVLLSIQLNTIANGNCLDLDSLTCSSKLACSFKLAIKRWFPSFKKVSAFCGVTEDWSSEVWNFISDTFYHKFKKRSFNYLCFYKNLLFFQVTNKIVKNRFLKLIHLFFRTFASLKQKRGKIWLIATSLKNAKAATLWWHFMCAI